MKSKLNKSPRKNAKDADLDRDAQMPGKAMTTNQGLQISDDQNSLKAGVRGPTLLEDFHFREKITHFDHERIPERVVHARGSAAHGFFECINPMTRFTRASIFAQKGKRTPVFMRFSTVAGSRGSADTPRDVRGFAVKFYTDQGVWDIVGNNIPIFFIQDAVKFPDLVHAVKPEPHNEIPQAASAHDTFYDFISLTPEAMPMIMWAMSDRALPRSFATMEGFGIHTFRFINARGESNFVKFHFKPKKGVHSLVWDESQKICGRDSDFQRRDLYESIENGDFPEWTMGVQIVPEKDEHKFDFDLLDPTKIIPEELVPVTPMGRLVLDRNPDNFFAETEQVAFHPGHIVPGIDFTNDPLLQGRLFSYLDTQLKRIGPNFAQLPINRPTCPMHNNQRDGESQQLVHKGKVAYFPNSLESGCPMHTPQAVESFRSYAQKMDGNKIRLRSPSFADHFSQATLFWNSMCDWEKTHIVDALSFELNNVRSEQVKQRMLDDLLINVAEEFAHRVAGNIGMVVKARPKVKRHNKTSPALSMNKPLKSIQGTRIAILCGEGVDGAQVKKLKSMFEFEGAAGIVIARQAKKAKAAGGQMIDIDMPAANAPSVIFDAAIVPAAAGEVDPLAKLFVMEAFGHAKTIGAIGSGARVLESAGISAAADARLASNAGVITGADAASVGRAFMQAMLKHRHFDRDVEAHKGAPRPKKSPTKVMTAKKMSAK